MNGSIIRKIFLPVAALILISGCAKISSPSGGPIDKLPPVITKSVPLNQTRNFKGKNIIVSFNEFVVLDRINEKFMVSPPMKTKPRILIRGKAVRIEFDDKLRDSTTYTFYFQDAIRDLNQGNPINNYQFVFSTGPVIDSLSVTGNVYNSLNLESPENTLVLLYSEMADSAVVKHLPDYITRVEKNGEFRIDNVRPGQYRLFALKDADNTKNYNLRDEEFAFMTEPVEIFPSKNFLPVKIDTAKVKPVDGKIPVKLPVTGEYKLILFAAEKKAHYLTSSSRKLPYQMIYTLSLPPDSMNFEFSIPGAGKEAYYIENSKNMDTVRIWLTDSTVYSQTQIPTIIGYPFTDSLGITARKIDTIMMRYLVPRPPRTKVVRRTPYNVTNGISSGSMRPDGQIILTASTPFRRPDTSQLRLYEILKEGKTKLPFRLIKDSTNSCRYFMNADLRQGKSYLFISDSAAFGNIYGEYSDSTGTKFSVLTPESFGKLTVNIKNYEGDRIIQLLSNSEKLVKQVYMKKDGKLEFPLLEKGFYRLRAIFDTNGDGKWTTGDFDTHLQPEAVSYYPTEIEIKVNWEITTPDWNLGSKNYKDFKLSEAYKTNK